MNKRILSLFIFLNICFAASLTASKLPPLFVKTVVIDAGHGGKDPGALGKKHKEKDIALAVALKLGKYIEENMPDVQVVYTRKTDVFVELQERAEIANRNKADFFISIHCNSNIKKEPHGSETYVMGIQNEKGKVDVAKRENASILLEDDYLKKYDGFDPNSDEAYIIFSMYQNVYLDQSLNLSAKIQKEYKEKACRSDKGVKRASLWVLWRTAMPSLLTEIGFISNPEEEKFLGSERGQDYISASIFRALRAYKNEMEGKNIHDKEAIEKQIPYLASIDTIKTDEIEKEKQKDSNSNLKNDSLIDEKENHQTTELQQHNLNEKQKNTETKNIGELYKEKLAKTPIDSAKTIDNQSLSKLVYKVQIAAAEKKISLDSEQFKGLEKLGEYHYDKMYKYTCGEFDTEKEAIKLQTELRKKGFSGAFVIAFKDGLRIK